MPVNKLVCIALLALASAAPAAAQQQPPANTVMVTVQGQVQTAGTYAVAERGRIGDAVVAAGPDSQAYVLGAALLRRSAMAEQVRLKAGLVYDLQQLSQQANAAVAEQAGQMLASIEPLPVTGRITGLQLEPRLLRLRPELNLPAESGDQVIYPTRPQQIRVTGAVAQECVLPQVADQDAKTYLLACPTTAAADSETVFVIQPDGKVQELGVALWNRSPAQSLAPGAVIYVPLKQHVAAKVDPVFNHQFAEFLATQLLPANGATP